jgi:polygalacturonase
MKNRSGNNTIIIGFLVIQFMFILNASATIVDYPIPPGLKTSPDFTLTANGKSIWVERIGSSIPSFNYALYGSRSMEDLNVANFSCSGQVTIMITATVNIDSFQIRPKSRNIITQADGHTITFQINGPQKLYIEVNGLPHLAIFANPLEADLPKAGGQEIIYFGPGKHDPGVIHLKDNQSIYIAGGAVVNADITGKAIKNVKIDGRGILNGKIVISRSSDIHISGIFIRNTKGWTNTLTDCHKASYRNVKIFSYEAIYSVDGIDPVSCTDFTIDDCFMRCRDDCVAIKSGDPKLRVDSIFVSNCVMVGWACSDGVTIGFELNGGPVENIFVNNCDILYARGGGRTEGHSAFSIVCDGPAWVRNIHFEDIRVEENVEFKNLELIVTDGTLYGKDPPGHIKGVYLKNIQWENQTKPFILSGFSFNNMIEDITFEKCRVGNKILTGINDANFRVNSFTGNIKFIP